MTNSDIRGYSFHAAAKSVAGIGVLNVNKRTAALSGFFVPMYDLIRIMVGRMGEPKGSPGFLVDRYANPVRLTTIDWRR